jgi:hypothetical protein
MPVEPDEPRHYIGASVEMKAMFVTFLAERNCRFGTIAKTKLFRDSLCPLAKTVLLLAESVPLHSLLPISTLTTMQSNEESSTFEVLRLLNTQNYIMSSMKVYDDMSIQLTSCLLLLLIPRWPPIHQHSHNLNRHHRQQQQPQ